MAASHLVSRLLEVVRVAREAGHCCFTVGDFCYRWQSETSEQSPPEVRIWQDAFGQDAGFCWLSGSDLHIVTRTETKTLRESIIAWGEDRIGAAAGKRRLQVPIVSGSREWETLLARRGYRPAEPELLLRSHTLEAIPEAGSPLAGYTVSHLQRADQLECWAATYRAAFAPEEMSAEVRRAIGENPLYRSDLDLIACDEVGEIVGFALAWFDPASASGTFEPLGCVPNHRRRGVSRALLIEGLHRLKGLGAQRAFVSTTRRRAPANLLYESVGFELVATSQTWAKPDA